MSSTVLVLASGTNFVIVQFLDIADRVVILNQGGEATVETDISKVMQHEEVRKIVDAMENSSVSSTDEGSTASKLAPTTQDSLRQVEEKAAERQPVGNTTIYRFYARSFKALQLLAYVMGTLVTAFGEVFSGQFALARKDASETYSN